MRRLGPRVPSRDTPPARGGRLLDRGLVAPVGALVGALVGAALLTGLDFEARAARTRRALEEGVPAEREAAAGELATLAPLEAEPLIGLALEDSELPVQQRAVAAAIDLHLVRALERTRTWLEDDDVDLRVLALIAEGSLGDATSVPLLTRALGDSRAVVRIAAVHALGALGLDACVAPLASALEDSDTTVRSEALAALGRVPSSAALTQIVARSVDPVVEVRLAAVAALAARAGEGALDPRVAPVLAARLDDASPDVRLQAVLGLGRARERVGVGSLASRLRQIALGPIAAPDAVRETRAIVAALGRIDDDEARAALVSAVGEDELAPMVFSAVRAQLAMRAEAMERALARAVTSADPSRLGALAALTTQGFGWGAGPDLALAWLERVRRGDLPVRVVPEPESPPEPHVQGQFRDAVALARFALHGGVADARRRPTGPTVGLVDVLPLLGDVAARAGTDEVIVELVVAARQPELRAPALDGLVRASRRGVLDGRVVDPLRMLAEAPDLAPADLLAIERALGPIGDARTVDWMLERLASPHAEASASETDALRAAALAGLVRANERGVLDAAQRERLGLAALEELTREDASDATTLRQLASRVVAASPPQDGARRALDALEASGTRDRAALAELLPTLAEASPEPETSERAELAWRALLASADPRLSGAAAYGAMGAHDARWRAALVEALALGEGDALAIRRALGEDAAASDASSLVDRALGAQFPDSVAASYELLVAAREGRLEASAVPRVCRLVERREPFVRSNAMLTLAALGGACEASPVDVLAQAHDASVALAALAWGERLAASPGFDARGFERARAACADRSLDVLVRTRCAAGALPRVELEPDVDVRAVTPARGLSVTTPSALVALRFDDGSGTVVRADGAGRVRLRLPHAAGLVRLDDPFALGLER